MVSAFHVLAFSVGFGLPRGAIGTPRYWFFPVADFVVTSCGCVPGGRKTKIA